MKLRRYWTILGQSVPHVAALMRATCSLSLLHSDTNAASKCSPDGAKRNPGAHLASVWSIPDCAELHPGYEAAAVPVWVGPGSAKRCCAPRRVRDTKSQVVRAMLDGISLGELLLATRASTGHRDMVPPWIDAEPAVLHLETCLHQLAREFSFRFQRSIRPAIFQQMPGRRVKARLGLLGLRQAAHAADDEDTFEPKNTTNFRKAPGSVVPDQAMQTTAVDHDIKRPFGKKQHLTNIALAERTGERTCSELLLGPGDGGFGNIDAMHLVALLRHQQRRRHAVAAA